MREYPGQLGATGHKRDLSQFLRMLAVAVLVSLLVLNCVDAYRGGADYWSSPALLICLAFVSVTANCLLLPARVVSLANIFLVLLFLFHMGYYIPVRLGLARGMRHMPPVEGHAANAVVTVFCAAVLSLELGYFLVAAYYGKPGRSAAPEALRGDWTTTARYAGCVIAAFSVVMLAVFLIQIGGPMALLKLSYTDLFAFFRDFDPRFGSTAMWYAPVGLLLWRVGLMRREGTSSGRLWWLAVAVLLVPFLLIGARGPAFLFGMGLLYLRHRYQQPYRAREIAGVIVLLALATPVIASYRNLRAVERVRGIQQAHFDILAPLLETGSTYRPYFGILEMMASSQQEFLHGRSYLIAARSVIPNVGAVDKTEPGTYYRTSTWFNYRLSPADSAAGVGIGCSMIAEQYANFGYFGVISVFAGLGAGIVSLEYHATIRSSVLARAVLAILILPLCWYIRDDIFGCVRMLIWPFLLLMLIHLLRLPIAHRRAVTGNFNLASGGAGDRSV